MKKHSTTSKTIRLFWQFTAPYKKLFWFGAIGAVLGVILQDIIPAFIVSRAFNALQHSNDVVSFHQLLPYMIGFAVSMVLGVILWRLQGYATWEFELRAERDMNIAIFHHLAKQGEKFHANRFGGALVSQTNKFVGAYERMFDDLIWSILPGLTVFLGSLGILFFVAYKFALILLAIIAVYIAVMSWRTKHQFPYNRRQAESETVRTAELADAITNVGTVRAFAQEDHELRQFTKTAQKAHNIYHELAIETFKNDSISHSMTNTLRIAALFFGLYAITNLHANVGVLYLVISYTSSIVDRLWLFGRIVRNVNRAFGDAAEMTEILGLEPEVKDPAKPLPAGIHRGTIDFKNVTFAYDEKPDQPLFKKLDLRIKPGEKVGLVGHSGGGKTTITRLLLRFMDIQKGTISIDGQDITAITQADLRKQIAYVPQEPMLFHRSLRDNIKYGNPEADDRVIEAAAKMAHAHEFILGLSHGYDTLVGERGVKLSGGQRQRIAIARAMIKNAPILLLDEATSALDSESEALIQDALWKLMEGRTAIVIAHRLSTIQKMDRIIVMDNGKIAEQGSHADLIRQNGIYANLWAHQSGGFIEE